MTTLTTWLITIGGAALALIFAFIRVWLSGAKAERNANRAKEADDREKELSDIADAAAARNAVRSDGMSDDKYRRD